MTVEEKLNLLKEAEDFFKDLSDAGELSYKLGLRKAAALCVVVQWLQTYEDKYLKWERTEEELKKALDMVIDKDSIEKMIEETEMSELESDFYRGWFGLASWIVEGNEEQIKAFREVQAAYDWLANFKLQNKTIGDLLK